jgi:glycosyltransferase involved in cell wall biosynthesis
LRKPVPPRELVTPFNVPEAVEDEWFAAAGTMRDTRVAPYVVASFGRPSVRNIVELTVARIHRFRDDVVWTQFDRPPAPSDLHGVDAWVDPALQDDDYDGFVAEAIVAGKPVVASRTPLNSSRLEKSRTGFLVPRNDPNELTHAILAALFKLEVAELKIEAARQTSGRFRARQRIRALERIYESAVK